MEKIATENIDLKLKLVEEFRKFESSLNGETKSNFHRIRLDAISTFQELGFPVKKLEEWKYTNISPILKHDYKTALPTYKSDLSIEDIEEFILEDKNINRLVFVNGQFNKDLSKLVTNDNRIFIGSLASGRILMNEVFEKHFSKYADYKNNSLCALNTALANDGAFIYVPKAFNLDQPIHLLNISDTKRESYMSQPRNLIIAEEGSGMIFIEDYYSIGDNHSYSNAVTEIYCGRNSNVERYKIQSEGDNSYFTGITQVQQESDSKFSDTTISWGGAITRNNLNSYFNGQNTECHFYGLYLLKNRQHVDNHTLADHAMPNCFSNELYKGIIDDKATGVFNGKIMVRPDAQKTNAYQSNNNILLSADATIYSKPQLEIFADDVKCSHGATSGQLSKDEMFYLRSRGIGPDDARSLLLYAYASDVIDTIKINELKQRISAKLRTKLRG